jgi:hypothetical protein
MIFLLFFYACKNDIIVAQYVVKNLVRTKIQENYLRFVPLRLLLSLGSDVKISINVFSDTSFCVLNEKKTKVVFETLKSIFILTYQQSAKDNTFLIQHDTA